MTDGSRVVFLRWPDEDVRRRDLEADGTPRLLIVGRGGPLPRQVGDLEDWVYEDADPTELAARTAQLQERVDGSPGSPRVEDGLLRFGDRWVAVPDSQLAVVELLVANADRVVGIDEIGDAYASSGGSTAPGSLKSLVHRLTRRFHAVGLRLHTVRRRGALLEVPSGVSPDRPAE